MPGIDWSLLALCVGIAALVGLLAYHSVAGYYHFRYYVRRRHEPETWKCQPKRFLSPRMHRTAVLLGTMNLTIAGLITGTLVYGVITGAVKTAIYTDVAEYGWAYTIGMTVVLFALTDYINYLVHRAMHIKFLFKHVHCIHHRFVATSGYVATAMHPVELLAQQVASLLLLFFIPFHAVSAMVVLLYILIFNVIDHSGVRLVSALPWQPPSAYHDDHHLHYHVNFGQHLMIWDRMHGTLRRQDRRYGKDVFGGRGAPLGNNHHSQGERGPRVRY